MITLVFENQTVKIDAGELVSYTVGDYEIMHQKGSPGWRNADTEMFPIIGPTDKANFRVQTSKGEAIQDQHGLLREMEYSVIENTEVLAVLEKKYQKNTPVKNSKYPVKSSEEALFWPYDFTFQKSFSLSSNGLEISFFILGEKDMPFMLGYHPAFKLRSATPIVKTVNKKISVEEIIAVGSKAMPILDCTSISLLDEKSVQIETEGFGNFMLWTEVNNMVCIEPVTFYPYAVKQENLPKGFISSSKEQREFKVHIKLD